MSDPHTSTSSNFTEYGLGYAITEDDTLPAKIKRLKLSRWSLFLMALGVRSIPVLYVEDDLIAVIRRVQERMAANILNTPLRDYSYD